MDQAPSVSVTFMPSESEIASALLWRTWRLARPGLAVLIVLDLALFICAIFSRPNTPVCLPSAVGLTVGIIIFVTLTNAKIRKQASKQFKAAESAGESTYTFSVDGLHIVNTRNTSNTSWQSFEKAEETSQFIMLFFPNNFFLFMPVQRFSSEQLNNLKALIRQKLGNAADL